MFARPTINYQPNQVRGYVEDLDGIPLEMLLIPPGTFTMGAPKTEEGSLDCERPQHKVTISTFFMGRYPITQAQWRKVAAMQRVARELDPGPSHFKGDKRPVESVSWYDAIEFCARLSREKKGEYRLPSEAEWEYACRAGTTTPFHFGETISKEIANYDGTGEKYGAYGRGTRGERRGETIDVDHFRGGNRFGLSVLHGNVFEWCLDPWHDDYRGAPDDGRVWDDKNNDNRYQSLLNSIDGLLTDNQSRVVRGGCWNNVPWYCRSAFRYDYGPGNGDGGLGFRVVRVPPRIP